MDELFRKFAHRTSEAVGSPISSCLALFVVLIWLASGPMFHYSDTWQLVINTSTSVMTFLMVFLIQNTQNREARALHLKLDELIRSHKSARNSFMEIERLSDAELNGLQQQLESLKGKDQALDRGLKVVKKLIDTHLAATSLPKTSPPQ